MITETYDILRRNIVYFIANLLAQTACLSFAGSSFVQHSHPALRIIDLPLLVLNIVLSAMLPYNIFRLRLLGFSFGKRPAHTKWGSGLFKLIAKAASLTLLWTIPYFILFFWARKTGIVVDPRRPPLSFCIPAAILNAICCSVVLSLWGTWLPASIGNRNTSFHAAYSRGTGGFWRMFACLLPCAIFAYCFSAAVVPVVATWNLSTPTQGSGLSIVNAVINFCAIASSTIFSSFAAVALSDLYLKQEIAESEPAAADAASAS